MKQFEEILKKSTPDLQKFCDFVLKWQTKVNLIAPSTIPDIWQRHIIDSAQLFKYIPEKSEVLLDMGSGGGFPGIVLAVLNKYAHTPLKTIYLVESDTKKSVFLQQAARVLDVPVIVINERLEKVVLENVDVVTARALKTVDELLTLGRGFISSKTVCLFLKGQGTDEELAHNTHPCSVQKIQSITHPKGCILQIGEVVL